jgi:hypothetical protein
MSTTTDRFSSREDVPWNQGCFDDGAEARIMGHGLDQCPSVDVIGEFAAQSWRAGWADADMQLTKDCMNSQITIPEPITEDWLRSVGFKWHQIERDRQPFKHWLLWMGGVAGIDPVTGTRKLFAGDEDLGIEISQVTTHAKEWHCWIRADYSGRYSRFVHIRHLTHTQEVIAIAEAMSGRKWNPGNHLYGKIFTEQQRKHIEERDRRFDVILVKERPWNDTEGDDSAGRSLPEHKHRAERTD